MKRHQLAFMKRIVCCTLMAASSLVVLTALTSKSMPGLRTNRHVLSVRAVDTSGGNRKLTVSSEDGREHSDALSSLIEQVQALADQQQKIILSTSTDTFSTITSVASPSSQSTEQSQTSPSDVSAANQDSSNTVLSNQQQAISVSEPAVVANLEEEETPTEPPELDYQQFDFKVNTMSAPTCDPVKEDEVDFTLVVQLSVSRLWIMKHHCKRWGDHHISLAVGTKTSSKVVTKALQALGCNMDLIKLTTVADFEGEEEYPVNQLRNTALSQIETSHALIIDADFLLTQGVYDSLMKQRAELAKDHKTALVIPAFELRPICDPTNPDCKEMHENLLPETKEDLLNFYTSPALEPTIAQFDSKNNDSGHGSTRYLNWISQKEGSLLPIECVTSPRYEPYVVVRYCQDLPPFQETFKGYGQNKLTWMQQVRRTGYRLYQMADSFAIHFPHAKSPAFHSWNSEKKKVNQDKALMRINQISASFQRWMIDNVPDQSVLAQC